MPGRPDAAGSAASEAASSRPRGGGLAPSGPAFLLHAHAHVHVHVHVYVELLRAARHGPRRHETVALGQCPWARLSMLHVRRRRSDGGECGLEHIHVRPTHLVVVAVPLPLELISVLRVGVPQLARHLA